MNSDRVTHLVSAMLRNVDMTDLADGVLRRINLKRRRPAMSTMSAIGWIGLGAVGAFAAVALIPAVRDALSDEPVRKLRAAMENAIGATEDAAMDAEHAVKRKINDAKETAKGALRNQSRQNNGNKLDV